jgi:hypothetical protein
MRGSIDTTSFFQQRSGVFVRLSKWSMVLALVLAIGGHWALLQSAAWLGMAVSFSKTESVSVALEKTFDGKHPCPLCKLVKAGKSSERKQDLQKLETKLDFLTDAGISLLPPSALTPPASRRCCRLHAQPDPSLK